MQKKRKGTVTEKRYQCPMIVKKKGDGHREALSVPDDRKKERRRSQRSAISAQ